MNFYVVAERLPESKIGRMVRVRAESEQEAALLGAVKMGMRWCRRKPGSAQRNAPGSRLFYVYGPYDRKSNAQHLIGEVRVT